MNIYGMMNSPSPVLISQSFTASETRVEEGVEFVSIPTLYIVLVLLNLLSTF